MRVSHIFVATVAALVLATGCSQQRSTASKGLETVEKALADVKADAAKYAPDGLKGVEAQYDRLKASLEAKEYGDVIAGTPQLEKAVASLRDAVASGKAHAKAALAAAKTEWDGLNVEVPKMVETIEARVDELSKRKIRLTVSKDELESSKTTLATMKSLWAEAKNEADKGDTVEAVGKAKTVKGMAQEVRDRLNIKES